MRKLSLLLCILIANIFIAEAQLKLGYYYKIKNSYAVGGALPLHYKESGTEITKLIAPHGMLKAMITPDSAGKLKVKFWKIKKPDTLKGSTQYVNSDDSTNNFHFQIPMQKTLADPNLYVSIPYALTEIGVLTIPFKYMFGRGKENIPNNASTEINGGIYIGRKWGRQRFYYDKGLNHESASFAFALFAGPAKIELTGKNVKDTSSFKGDSNELAVSTGLGAMYSYRSINIGLFGGWDFPVSSTGKNWVYSKKFWIGFGIGYSLSMLGAGK